MTSQYLQKSKWWTTEMTVIDSQNFSKKANVDHTILNDDPDNVDDNQHKKNRRR